jgi:hypothetical protein
MSAQRFGNCHCCTVSVQMQAAARRQSGQAVRAAACQGLTGRQANLIMGGGPHRQQMVSSPAAEQAGRGQGRGNVW